MYDLTLTHTNTDIPIADTLSRKFLSETYPQLSAGMDLNVHMVVSNSRISSRRMVEVKTATQADPQMKVVMQLVQDCRPEIRKSCPAGKISWIDFTLTSLSDVRFTFCF